MLRLLIDQDFDHDILRGLIRRVPDLEAVTALEIGMSEGVRSGTACVGGAGKTCDRNA